MVGSPPRDRGAALLFGNGSMERGGAGHHDEG